MKDVETLREAWDRPEPPSPAAQSAARAALLARAAGRRPKPRWLGRRLTVAASVAASVVVIATSATLVQTVGRTEPTHPAASAQAMPPTMVATVQKDFPPPRDDQWIYTELRIQGHNYKGRKVEQLTPQTPLKSMVHEFWARADGKRVAYKVNGKLMTSNPGERSPENTYAILVALPTDPDKLLARFRKIYSMRGADQDDWIFERFAVTLQANIVPPALEAAIFQAMTKIPSVKVNESAVDVEGRPALSVSRVVDGWRNFEILLDPATYAFRGRRETAAVDHEERVPRPGVKAFTIKDGKRVPMPPRVEWTIQKGTVWMMSTRTAVGVVDQAGQKP
ncbi:CU044_5270 family protein [Nonomuraea sp. H19]|uniref:CU044_5270 family protein n=1 Tax=Nonomuraea sp. H19 TaxID=3452206 RepID=UPI003F8B9741